GTFERRHPDRLRPAGRWSAGHRGVRSDMRPGFDASDRRGAGEAFHRVRL
ncbi:hypothetical protein AVDCRST_MAG82-265, partial [uncultured Rubrobacteraceae bacterium]